MNYQDNRSGISAELASGIAAYEARIAPLMGQRVSITTPDGSQRTGIFGEASKCQPVVRTDDGRSYMVTNSELDRLVAEVAP